MQLEICGWIRLYKFLKSDPSKFRSTTQHYLWDHVLPMIKCSLPTHFSSILYSSCIFQTIWLSWKGHLLSICLYFMLSQVSQKLLHGSGHIYEKLSVHYIARHFFFHKISNFCNFLSFKWKPIRAKISKQYFSHSFSLISIKLYDKHVSHGWI